MATKEEKQQKAIEKKAEQAYYEEAKEWESEKYRAARGRARFMAWIAGISILFASLCVLTMMMILPLKEAVPYVIEVDRNTGITQVKRTITEEGISESEAITKYFIVDYLTAREAYMYSRADVDYVKVQKMSSADVASTYYEWFQPSNDESPLNVFGRSGTVEIEIRNVSFIDGDTVTIPIIRVEKTKGQTVKKYDVVTMDFKFVKDPATEEDRFINPLGFQVTSYRKDPQLTQGIEQ